MEHNEFNKSIRAFKKDARSVRLSAAEKAAGKARVFSEIGMPEVRPNLFFIFENIYVRTVTSAALIAIVIGVPAAFAAERSLPGDPLYGLKTHVNEEVASLFVRQDAKAEYHLSLAEKRIEELAKLAETKSLDSDKASLIEANLIQHSAAVLADVTTPDSARINLSPQEDLITILSTYATVVATLDSKTETTVHVEELIDKTEQSLEDYIELINEVAPEGEGELVLQEVIDANVGDLSFDIEDSNTMLKAAATVEFAEDLNEIVPEVTEVVEDLRVVDSESIEEKEAFLKKLVTRKAELRSASKSAAFKERLRAALEDANDRDSTDGSDSEDDTESSDDGDQDEENNSDADDDVSDDGGILPLNLLNR